MVMARFGPRIARLRSEGSLQHGFFGSGICETPNHDLAGFEACLGGLGFPYPRAATDLGAAARNGPKNLRINGTTENRSSTISGIDTADPGDIQHRRVPLRPPIIGARPSGQGPLHRRAFLEGSCNRQGDGSRAGSPGRRGTLDRLLGRTTRHREDRRAGEPPRQTGPAQR